MPNFPRDWPDNCPPPDAVGAAGEVYRIVSSNPVTADDIRSYAELGIPARGSACRRHGISVYQTRDKAHHRLRLSPHLGSAVAKGTLRPEHGKQKLTDRASGHIAWWCASGVDRVQIFGEVEPCR